MTRLNRFIVVSSVVLFIASVLLLASSSRGAAASGTANPDLTEYQATSKTPVQDMRPIVQQRAVRLDGGLEGIAAISGQIRIAHGSGGGGAPVRAPSGMLSGVRLYTGTYQINNIDLQLPAPGFSWVIGRTYNARQEYDSAHLDSNGYQGRNWSQSSQPEILLYEGDTDDEDVVYLVLGADQFVEFHRHDFYSDVFEAVNGSAGAFLFEAGAANEPDTYTYYDAGATRMVFFGFDVDADPADGQLWKIIDPAGNTAYVGDESDAGDAITNGFDADGRILYAYDTADRRYAYTYTTIDSVKRLTKVEVAVNSGGWTNTGDQVEYDYYQTGDNTYGDNGCLQMVTITTPLSDSGVNDVRKRYYRYWKGTFDAETNPGHPYGLQYVVDFEGTRRFDWSDDTFDEDFLTATENSLKPYASAYFEYDSSHRISEAWFNGACGCGGASNGTHEFTYATNGSYSDDTDEYDEEWQTRTVVKRPDGTYLTQYFDEAGQALHKVITDADPSGSPNDTWVIAVDRGSGGELDSVSTPAAVTAYTHSTGAVTTSTSNGLIKKHTHLSDDLAAFVEYGKGHVSTDNYLDVLFARSTRTLELDDTGLTVPRTTSVRRYYEPEVSGTNNSVLTQFSYTFYEENAANDDQIDYVLMETVTTTNPTVTTSKNGSGTATTSKVYLGKDGQVTFRKSTDGIIDYTEYTNGQVTKRIEDADTTKTGSGEDFENVTIPTGFSSSGSPVHRVTTFTYDDQGRQDTVTQPDGRVTKTYYSKLADGRVVTLSYPKFTDGSPDTFYGPLSYSVRNQAGRVEAQGTIKLDDNSGSYTTDAITTHIDETDDDPVTAMDNIGELARLSTSKYDETGEVLEESRSYFDIPASGEGTDGTNYDPTKYGYDDEGRRWRVKQPTGTITRSVYDDLGRVTETWVGTNDYSFTGGETSGTDNMVKVSAVEFDDGNDAGNGLVTKRTLYVQDSDTGKRETTYDHDVYGRVLLQTNPTEPKHVLNDFDHMGRLVATAQFDVGDGTDDVEAGDDPVTRTDDRLSLSRTFYDEMGRVWKTQRHKIDASDGSDDDHLKAQRWYDSAGRVIQTDGEQLVKMSYDRLGRQTHRFVLADDNDTAYSDADDVSGDIVLEEYQTVYESNNSDRAIMTAVIERFHDDYGGSETTGALDTNADSDDLKYTAANLEGRIQIVSRWYDNLDRLTDTVRYGTYGGSDFDRDGLSVPARSDTALLTEHAYNADGSLQSITDPRNLETRFAYDDAGRKVTEIADYVDGTPSGATDHHTRFVYTDGLQTKMWVDLDGDNIEDADDQVTEYDHGTVKGASAGDSKIATGHLLQETTYPDSGGASDVVTFAYNAQSQEIYRQDQEGNVFETDYDDSGRVTHKRITTIDADFDDAVRRISTTYDDLGRAETVTQYDNATVGSGSVVDEVKFTYALAGWGSITKFEQDHDSAIGSTLLYDVEFDYEKPSIDREIVRRTTMKLPRTDSLYPDGQPVTYTYLDTDGLHDKEASRVTQVKLRSAAIRAAYEYNGVGIVVGIDHPRIDVMRQLYGSTSGSYPDLDRFNRVTSRRWTKDLATDVDFYDVDITYDRNGNIVLVEDNVHAGFDVDYSIDDRDRLTQAEEGTWGGSSITTTSRDEQWTLDQLGNWDINKLDLNGDGDFVDTGELNDDRTHNVVNELTARDTDDNDTDDYTLTYDAVGNLTDDGQHYEYEYDPFGRLRYVKDTGDQSVVAEFTYNGLGYRIGAHYDTDLNGEVDANDTWRRFVYDDRWRIVEMYEDSESDPEEQYLYHAPGSKGLGTSGYIDDVVLRHRGPGELGSFTETHYYCQNWRHDVVAMIDDNGNGQLEQVRHSSYGVPFNLPAGDGDSDGDVDASDESYANGLIGSGYDVRVDLDLDGDVDASDVTAINNNYGSRGRGVLSDDAIANRKGCAGYEFDDYLADAWSLYHVRHRVLISDLGRWIRRDPLGHVDGPSLYELDSSRPVSSSDPLGLAANDPEGTVYCYDPDVVDACIDIECGVHQDNDAILRERYEACYDQAAYEFDECLGLFGCDSSLDPWDMGPLCAGIYVGCARVRNASETACDAVWQSQIDTNLLYLHACIYNCKVTNSDPYQGPLCPPELVRSPWQPIPWPPKIHFYPRPGIRSWCGPFDAICAE